MAALLGGASGAAGAGALGAAGTTAATQAAPAATSAAGSGALGAAGSTYASGYAPTYAAMGTPTYPTVQTMTASEYLRSMQGPQQPGFDPSGAQFQETAARMAPQQTWMQKLLEYAKKNPSPYVDRSTPSAPNAGPPLPPQYSHLLGMSGNYPTLAALMSSTLPTMQTRG